MTNFNEILSDLYAQIEKVGKGVLATSEENKVTTRMMSIIVLNQKIYMQTSNKLIKYKQIQKNPNISLCFSNINLFGKAKILEGQVLQNNEFSSAFQKKHLSSFDAYSHMQSNRIIEVEIDEIHVWSYEDEEPVRYFLDIHHKQIKKELYPHSSKD